MALGLLLQVSCICLILFDGSTALPAQRRYRFSDSRNIGDDAGDQVLITSDFDQSTWQASNKKLSGPRHTRYDKQPNPVPYQLITQSAPGLEGLSNESGDWGTDRDERFPYLQTEPVKPQSGSVQPQAPVYQKPVPQSQSSGTWQSKPVSSGYVPHLETPDSSPVHEGGPSQANYFAPPPPPPRSSYIIQSRNGYLQARYLRTHTKYTPEFPAAMPPMVRAAKRPAPSNAAAPKGLKEPTGNQHESGS